MSPRLSIIPAGAVTDRSLEPRDLQVLCLLGRHTDKLGWCVRSQVRMAAELDCGRSSVQRSLERLVAAGWVEKKQRTLVPEGTEPPQPHASYAYRVRLDRDDCAFESAREKSEDEATESENCPSVGTLESEPETVENPSPEAVEPPTSGHPGAHPCVGTGAQPYVGTKNDPLERPHLERERDVRARDRKAKGLVAFEARWPTAAADDRNRTAYAWEELTEAEEEAALAGIAAFLENLKRLSRKHIPAGWRYIEDKRWEMLAKAAAETAARAVGGPYDPKSDAGRAILALTRIARSSVPRMGDGRLIYTKPITPQLLALAQAKPGGAVYSIGTGNYRSWFDFLKGHLSLMPKLPDIEAPWPWPPSKDGTVYDQASTPSSTGPPPQDRIEGTLATAEDLKEFATKG